MSITTYSELQTAVASWLARTDLTDAIPDFIALAEERINRHLRVRQMESALAETSITDNRIAVPSGTVGVKVLWVPGYERTPLTTQTYESVVSLGTEGIPTCWAWSGDYFHFDGTGSVQGVLYQRIAALSDSNTANWLLTNHPSLYLSGAVAEGWAYLNAGEQATAWDGRFRAILDEIHGNDRRDTYGGPLVARAR